MPFAAKCPCAGGCGRLVVNGYCEHCRAAGKAAEKRPTAARRGYGSRWQKASAGWLRVHPIAVDWFGEHNGRVFAAQVVDHIIPHKGDMTLFWDNTNWQGLTKADHDRKTQLENSGRGRWVNAGTSEELAMRWQRMG